MDTLYFSPLEHPLDVDPAVVLPENMPLADSQAIDCSQNYTTGNLPPSYLPRYLKICWCFSCESTQTSTQIKTCIIMAALCNRSGHHIFARWFLFIFLSFFFSPNLRGRRSDVYHSSTHAVALVRI